MIKLTVYYNGKVARVWKVESYEVLYECGYENVYVEKDGIRTKAVTVGDFGSGYWGYDIEYIA